MKGFFDSVNWVLTLGLVGFALWAWPKLPDRIPTHFGPDGMADAWSDTTLASWLRAPAIALLILAFIGWFRWMMPRNPGWVNLPDKTKLDSMPEAARKPILEMLAGFLALVQTEILVVFALIQLGTFRSAQGLESEGLIILVLLLAILASPVLLVVFFLRLQGAMERSRELERRHAAPPA